MAAHHWAVDVARLLLDHGVDPDPVNKYGNTPLWTAVFNSRGRAALISLLRAWGADPLKANKAGQTPLGLARGIANYDVARYFADLPLSEEDLS